MDGVKVLFPILLPKYSKNPGILHINIRRLRGGEKKANLLGTSVAEEQHGSELPWFAFCLTYPRLGAGEDGN